MSNENKSDKGEEKEELKKRRHEVQRRVKPRDIGQLLLELTEATLDRGLKWEPTATSGFVTTIGTNTFKVELESDVEPPYSSFPVFAILDIKGRESWRETGATVSSLFQVVKRIVHGVDQTIQESLEELRKLYPEPFGLKVRGLKNLNWANVSAPGEDGNTWSVEEEGGAGYTFQVSLSDRERNRTPEGTKPIERDDFPTESEIKDAIRRAIERALVSPGNEDIKPENRFPITVTCFDLYNAAGVVC